MNYNALTNGQGQKLTANVTTMGKAAMRMLSQAKIKFMMCLVVLALTGGVSTVRADVLLWEFQDEQPGIQEAKASTVDSHGNMIITGYTDTAGDDDFYTIKVDSITHAVLWSARYTHPGDDWAVAVAVDSEDNVIVAGYILNGLRLDIGVIKYDGVNGAPLWTSPYLMNGPADGNDFATGLAVDGLNSIYVIGYTNSGSASGDDAIIFKLGPGGPAGDGEPLWKVSYDGDSHGNDRFTSISIRAGAIAVTGYSTVNHSGRLDYDFLTMKLDTLGTTIWTKVYDNGVGDDEGAYAGIDSAGNVIVAGDVSASGQLDMATIKYAAADGAQSWIKNYSGGSPNHAKGLVVGSDDDVFVIGDTSTPSGMHDYYTARYAKETGGPVWEKVFDSGNGDDDIPQALAVDNTSGLYVTGRTIIGTDDDFQTLKYNQANGNLIWEQGPQVVGGQHPVGVVVALGLAADGNIYVGGYSQVAVDDVDYYAVKYDASLLNTPTDLSATVDKVVDQGAVVYHVDLSWADNSAAPNEETFCIKRCSGYKCNDGFTVLTCDIAQNTTIYADGTVDPDQWYTYQVYGKNQYLADSLPSDPVSALTTVIDYPAPDWLYLMDVSGLNDKAYAIVTDSDNNPVATGLSTTGPTQYDYFTVKLDRTEVGIPAQVGAPPLVTHPFWVATYDDDDSQVDMGVSLAVDGNDDVVVTGDASLDIGIGYNSSAIFTIKYDGLTGPDPYSGAPLWQAQYSGPVGGYNAHAKVVGASTDNSNSVVVTGYGKNTNGIDQIYLVKYKSDYDLANQQEWAITASEGIYHTYPTATAFTPSNEVIVVGMAYNSSGNSDQFISKYTAGGILVGGGLWPHAFAPGVGNDGLNAVAVGEDGSIYVAGYVMNVAGNLDIFIDKYNSAGVSQWDNGKIITGGGVGLDEAKAIAIDPNDGEILVGATITSVSGKTDFHLMRYRPDGTLRWQKTLDLPDTDEVLVGMAVSPSGEICLTGDTEKGSDTDMLAVKYDHLGNLTGSTKFDNGFDDVATAVTANRLGEFYIAGYSLTGWDIDDDDDFVVFRFNAEHQLQAPAPFSATAHNSSVDLSWTENDASVSGYKLYRINQACTEGGSTFGPSDLIQTLAQGDVTFNDHPVNIGSTYCYGVEAYRSTGEVSRISEHQVMTSVPVAPSGVVGFYDSTSAVEVCWHDNSTSEDGFKIQRCIGNNCVNFTDYVTVPPELNPAATQTCWVDTDACDSGKQFRYRVESFKLNEWASGYDGATATVNVPSLVAPTSLTLRPATDAQTEAKIDLEWTDISNDDESGYSIERCLGAGCTNFLEVGTVSAVSGIDLHLMMNNNWSDSSGKARTVTASGSPTFTAADTLNRPYFYTSGYLNASSQYLTSSLVIDQSAQSAGVTMMGWAKPYSSDGNWRYLFSTENGNPTPNNSWGLVNYNGYWYVATGNGVYSTGATVTTNTWQHVAVVFTPGVGIKFYKDNVAYTALNSPGSIDTHATSGNFIIGRQGVLNQNYFYGGVDEVAVYNRALTSTEIQGLKTVGVFPESTGLKFFTDSTVSPAQIYRYQVKARKQTSCGFTYSGQSNIATGDTTPHPPNNQAGTWIGPGVAHITWNSQTTLQTGFRIERCPDASCSSISGTFNLMDPTARKYTDRTACYDASGANYYRVRALGSWGVSGASPTTSSLNGDIPDATTLTFAPTEANVKLNWLYNRNYSNFTVERCTGTLAACNSGGTYLAVPGSPFSGHDSALQGFWRMDDASWSGTSYDVSDSSGNGKHGKAWNGAAIDTPGATSNGTTGNYYGPGAASLNGSTQYIETPLTVNQSTTTTGATFMAWVKLNASDGNYRYIFSTDNAGSDWGLAEASGNLYVANGSGLTYIGGSISLNTWQFVAVVFDPATGTKVCVDSNCYTNTNIDYDSSAANFTIGRQGSYTSSNAYFNGKIDQVRVFSRPLSTTEVQYYKDLTTANTVTVTDTDPTILPSTTYTYRVTPVVASTVCGDWQQIVAPITAATTTLGTLSDPSNLLVTANTSKFDLTWQDNSASESGFVIERCAGAGCSDFAALGEPGPTVGPGVTSYTDSTVCENQTFRYRVKAVKGTSAPWTMESGYVTSADKTTTTANAVAAPTLALISEAQVDVSWYDPNLDEDAYDLYRCVFQEGVTLCDQPAQFTLLQTFLGTYSGALLQYSMDEASWNNTANQVKDATGNARHGRAYPNTTTTVAAGRFGRAGDFNGSTSYVSTTLPATSINQKAGSPGATMAAWVYPHTSTANWRHVLSTEDGGNDWGIIAYNGYWYVNTGASTMNTGKTVELNTWQHVTAVYTPGSATQVTFYKYSVAGGLVTFTSTEIGYDVSTAAFEIGRDAGTSTSTSYFDGLIDEVLVYGRPLTLAEVTNHNFYKEATTTTPVFYNDKTVQHSSTYYYKVTGRKTTPNCTWSKESPTSNISTPFPPPPTEFVVVSKNTTSAKFTWKDNNGSETGYKIGRCPGATYSCGAGAYVVNQPIGPGSGTTMPTAVSPFTPYEDTGLSKGQTYTYRVWATGSWGDTVAAELVMTTDNSVTPTLLPATPISEVGIKLDWTYTTADETGVKLERCLGASCADIATLAANTKTYSDNELTSNTEYCYRVRTYKTATNSWEGTPSEQACASTIITPGALTATPVNTTTVNVAWNDTTQTETTSSVGRCDGDLNTCCPGGPNACTGDFTPSVGVVGRDQHEFTDTTACPNTAYTYQVNTNDEGLSKGNTGCWTKRAKLTFTTFEAFKGVQLLVDIKPGMQAGFEDIRFYDATGHRELQYWIKQKNASQATVWLMTGANNNIYLYYDNDAATDGSATDAVFTDTYTFTGTTIDTQKWVEIDPTYNKVTQNNGLKFSAIYSGLDTAVISTKTYGRALDNELYIDFTIGNDASGRTDESFFMGWETNQTASAAWSGMGAHLLYFTSGNSTSSSSIRTFYMNSVYEYQTQDNFTLSTYFPYNDNTSYQMKIVLSSPHGAKYYLKGGRYADWVLLKETTTHRTNDDTLRIGFHHGWHNVTINQVKVKSASAQMGATVNWAGAEGDGVTCLTFSHTWIGSPTSADDALTYPVLPPTGLTANVDEGKVTLAWTAGTGDESEFQVERNCGSGYELIETVPGNIKTFTDDEIPASTLCAYQVKGHKDSSPAECSWTSNPVSTANLLAPPAGPVVTAMALNPFQVQLKWSNNAADEEGYDVEVQVFNGFWVLVASLPPNTLTYTDSHGINPSTKYTYRVRARRAADNSAWGQSSITTPAYTSGAATCTLPGQE